MNMSMLLRQQRAEREAIETRYEQECTEIEELCSALSDKYGAERKALKLKQKQERNSLKELR